MSENEPRLARRTERRRPATASTSRPTRQAPPHGEEATVLDRVADPDRHRVRPDLPDPDLRREGLLRAVRLDGADPARRRASGGDRILANKVVYDFRDPQQGDVVVFAGPPTWAPETRIAGPDQLVRLRRCSRSVRWSASRRRTRRTTSSGSSRSAARPSVLRRRRATSRSTDARWSSRTSTSRSSSSPASWTAPPTQMSRRCFGPVTCRTDSCG